MNLLTLSENEQRAAAGFTAQSGLFDRLYGQNPMIAYKRMRVRRHAEQYLVAGSHILELNAGTCEDAIHFARQGHTVHATDISEGMLAQGRQKISAQELESSISTEQCSFTQLQQLRQRGPYDMIFSNFAGLNCTDRLEKVLETLPSLVKPGGVVTLVILPPFCLWECLLLFRGKWRTAFRRFGKKRTAPARVEGSHFTCFYYRPALVIKTLLHDFDLLSLEGLCSLSPPSYLEGFAEKRPGLYRLLCGLEERWCRRFPWKYIGDYYIISLRKRPV